MKSFKSIFALAAVAVLTLVSCNTSDDTPYVTRWPYSDNACFLRVTDLNSGDVSTATGVSYTLEFNYTDVKANITISGLKLGNTSFPAIVLKDMPFSYDQSGWKHIVVSDIDASISGFSDVPHFDRFTLSILERVIKELNPSTGMMEDVYSPVIWVSYEVDGRYSVATYPRTMKYFGTTTTRSLESTETKKSTDTWYQIDINPANLEAEVKIHEPAFAEGMPSSLILQFPGLPCSIQGNQIGMSKDEVTPAVGGVAFSRAKVTNFVAQLGVTGNLNLNFNCDFAGNLYSVTATCAVIPVTGSN